MCNRAHKAGLALIPTTGRGWKIFDLDPLDREMMPMAHKNQVSYRKDEEGWAEWDHNYHTFLRPVPSSSEEHEFGFCFFRNEEEAQDVYEQWKEVFPNRNVALVEIEYDGGVAEFTSVELDGYERRFSIAKAFRPVNGWRM